MLDSAETFFRKVFWKSMNARKESGARRGDIIDQLADLKNEGRNVDFHFKGDQLVAQSFIMLTAGSETSATTISFTLYELSRNPEVQARVRQEIRKKNRCQRSADVRARLRNELSAPGCLRNVEALSPAPILDRVALADYKIPETESAIEKGTVVYTALNGIHRDPEFYPEPLKYDPDRFSVTRKQEIKPGTYMPFGDGMRIGTLQTVVGLITILSEYEVSPDPDCENSVSKRAIFTAPAGGLYLRLKRNSVLQ